MPIHYIEGDLLENEYNARAFAIESNTEGLMNTQMAVQFRTRYPRLYESYRSYCHSEPPQFNPGDVFVWEDNTGQIVYNLAIYADPYLTLAGREDINKTFAELRRLAEENRVDSIAMPPIAAGMGGLNWRGAKRALEETFDGFQGDVYVYMKNKAPERDLDAIQSKIDESSSSKDNRRNDDDDNKSGNRRNRRGRRRSGRGRRSNNKSGDSSGNQSAAKSDDKQASGTQSNDSNKSSDQNQNKSEGGGSNRSRRGRRGRGRRGGRNRNRQNKGDNNKQNNNAGDNNKSNQKSD